VGTRNGHANETTTPDARDSEVRGGIARGFRHTIDDAVARGRAGEETFFASENGRTVGTRAMDHYNVWVADDSGARQILLQRLRRFVRRNTYAMQPTSIIN